MWWRSLFWLAGLMVLGEQAARAQMAQPPTTPVPTANQVDSRLLSPGFGDDASRPTSLKTFACTAKTLVKDTTCVFLGEPEPIPNVDRRAANAKAAGEFANVLCEEMIGKPCATSTTAIERACGLARSPTDSQGRFRPEASDCYAAMREHFDVAQASSTFETCCQCATSCGDASGCTKTKSPTLVGMCAQTCASVCGRGGRQ